MESNIYLKLLLIIATVLFSSCEKDESAKPLIDNFELGYQNSKKATLGNDLHINAEVVAEGKINTIEVVIHSEEEHHGKGPGNVYHVSEWEFDSTYTEFSGLKNTTFHKHVEIPVTADTGTYHFHFIVTDLEGNQTAIEEDLLIEQPDDTMAHVITITQSPASGEPFTNGQTITIKGTI